MRVAIFIITILNLIYVPVRVCVNVTCFDRKYDFLFSIHSNYQLDYEKLGLQLLILAILFLGTYSKLYKTMILKIKRIDKEEKLSENLFNSDFIIGAVIIVVLIFLFVKLINSGSDALSAFINTLGEDKIEQIIKEKNKTDSSNSQETTSETIYDRFVEAHNSAKSAGEKYFKFEGKMYTVGPSMLQGI
jgi:hypothetical protein